MSSDSEITAMPPEVTGHRSAGSPRSRGHQRSPEVTRGRHHLPRLAYSVSRGAVTLSEPSRPARLKVSGWGGGGRAGAGSRAAADTSVWSIEEVRRGGGGGFGRPETHTDEQ